VLVVTHGLAMATALCVARNLPLHQVFDQLPENARPAIVRWPPEFATDDTDSTDSDCNQ
jgi:broad specificity phosphatase PhoE